MNANAYAAASAPSNGTQARPHWPTTQTFGAADTQVMADVNDYLAPQAQPEVGRRIDAIAHELFVSCAPELAMQQQFEQLHPDFIAIHDLTNSAALRLLTSLASSTGKPVQSLAIRRHGQGIALATIKFIELSTEGGRMVRLYAADADAATSSRQGLVRTLLGFSRLAVVLIGDLPAHATASALKPIRDALSSAHWPNRHLLLMPLAGNAALAEQGSDLPRGTHVAVRTTSQVKNPADAWAFINQGWERMLAGQVGTQVIAKLAALPAFAPKPTPGEGKPATEGIPGGLERRGPNRLHTRVGPPPAQVRPNDPVAMQALLERYARQVSEVPGVVGCCVFQIDTGAPRAQAMRDDGPDGLGAHGQKLITQLLAISRQLGWGESSPPEAVITLGNHHLLLRGLPGHSQCALHAAFDKANTNLILAQRQIERLDALFA